MPGGGVGLFDACTSEWPAPAGGWGQQYGGISSTGGRSQCDSFAPHLQAGCYWRYDWFGGGDNPTVDFEPIACPAAITAKSGCVKAGDVPTGPSSVGASIGGASASSSAPASPVSSVDTGAQTSVVASPSSSSVAAPPSQSSSAPAPAGDSGATAAKWQQCGGKLWTGATTCASGTTCQVQNDYYSQCL